MGGRMESDHIPRVSVCLPVRNGEKYLDQAIESLLAQTYADFELVICDNDSSDDTARISLQWAQRDPRVRYVYYGTMVGAGENFNRALLLARGEYLRWASYDDLCDPTLLGKCVEVLDNHPTVSMVYTMFRDIDETGQSLGVKDITIGTESTPVERFCHGTSLGYPIVQFYGLMRGSVILSTRLFRPYTDSDRTLVCEMALRGKFYRIPEVLFFRRVHKTKSTTVMPNWRARMVWWDPSAAHRITLPHWLQFFDYLETIRRVPLPMVVKMRCSLHMVAWLTKEWHGRWMAKDLLVAAKRWITRT